MTEEIKVLPKEVSKIYHAICGCADRGVWTVIQERLQRCADKKFVHEFDSPEQEFVEHILSHFDYTEHGVSIRGAWLTEKGEFLLNFLKTQPPDWMEEEWDLPF